MGMSGATQPFGVRYRIGVLSLAVDQIFFVFLLVCERRLVSRMKLQKFFARDKLKPAKVTSLGRDVDAGIIDEASVLTPSTAYPGL